MSGYKHATVTISQDEYRRLQEADIRKRFKEFTKITTEETGQNEIVLNLIREMEARELQLQSALSELGNQSNQYNDQVLQDLLYQNNMYYENLASILRDTNTDMRYTFSSMSDEFNQMMQREREHFYSSIQSIVVEQDAYLTRESAKEEAAQEWLNRCIVLVNFLQSQFDTNRFTPGRLDKIIRNLNLAENNLANGYSEISLQNSQQSFLDLTDMNFDLEQLNLQWQSSFVSTFSAINEFVFQMESNTQVRGLDLQGNELPNFVDINFWTDGKFQQLLEHCKQLATYLHEDQQLLTFEDLDRIYTQILPVIRESFESLIVDARMNALNSQLRMNIAEKALQALESHGFVLDKSGYSENDMRSQFNAHLQCMDGSQVTIQVLPTEKPSHELSNELVVITTHPYLKSEHEARMHWEELSQTLRQYHLRVSRPDSNTAASGSQFDQSSQSRLIEQTQELIER